MQATINTSSIIRAARRKVTVNPRKQNTHTMILAIAFFAGLSISVTKLSRNIIVSVTNCEFNIITSLQEP